MKNLSFKRNHLLKYDNTIIIYGTISTDSDLTYVPKVFDEKTGDYIVNKRLLYSQDFDAEQLFSISDLVVKVTATSEKDLKFEAFLATVKVNKVYKGDNPLVNAIIFCK